MECKILLTTVDNISQMLILRYDQSQPLFVCLLLHFFNKNLPVCLEGAKAIRRRQIKVSASLIYSLVPTEYLILY